MATNMAAVPLDDFAQRFHTLQAQRHTMDELYKELYRYCEVIINQYDEQHKKLKDAWLDCDAATKARRELQQEVQAYKSEQERLIKENALLKSRNPYIMVLIDGDGLIFQDHWIKQGLEGGKAAAYALRNTIAQQFGEDIEGIEVVAKVVANLGGLAKAMQRESGLEAHMRDFALGFTQAKASFDFVDVGYGKERADSKIKELTRWNLRNLNCKHMVLGISHDSGYAPFLDDILGDVETRQRVSILEGVSTVREIVNSQVNIFRAQDDMFRKDKIQERSALLPSTHTNAGGPISSAVLEHPYTPPENASLTASPASANSGLAAATPTSSYAGVSKGASPPPQMTFPLPIRQSAAQRQTRAQSTVYQLFPPQQLDWEPGPRGLDEPIKVATNVWESVKKRKDNNKLCNNHYLRGPCVKDNCQFVHDYQASKDEINAIAVLARQNPCDAGQYCQLLDCMYGHHCPSIVNGVCIHPRCRFSEDAHPPGTKYKSIALR